MTYAASIGKLLSVLHKKAPALADALAVDRRRCVDGLLSVGSKIHCINDHGEFDELINAIGGPETLTVNGFRGKHASWCIVLPPVGSSDAQVCLIECIAQYIGAPIFGNPDYQLQLCSPGRLDNRRSALLAILCYLGSDTIRAYGMEDLETTFSDEGYFRGRRLVIYDAGMGSDFDDKYEWWRVCDGNLQVLPKLPVPQQRTDMLFGTGTERDVRVFNLVASLLTHRQFPILNGCWQGPGRRFEDEATQLLEEHMIDHILEAPWVEGIKNSETPAERDREFSTALKDLVSYARGEADRLSKKTDFLSQDTEGRVMNPGSGILGSVHQLLQRFEFEIKEQSRAWQRSKRKEK